MLLQGRRKRRTDVCGWWLVGRGSGGCASWQGWCVCARRERVAGGGGGGGGVQGIGALRKLSPWLCFLLFITACVQRMMEETGKSNMFTHVVKIKTPLLRKWLGLTEEDTVWHQVQVCVRHC